MRLDESILSDIYSELIEEGLDQKIPKVVGLVPDNVEDKEAYVRWAAEQFDPTKNAAYITWILKMLGSGSIVGEEDSDKVKSTLKNFTGLKKKPQFPQEHRDINRFKQYGDLAQVVAKYSDVETKGEKQRRIREEGIQLMETYGDEELYIVTEAEAAAKHFRDTQWCVKDPRYFNDYGAPYYYFKEDGEPSVLLHLGSNQCMDVYDRNTELSEEQREMMETQKMTSFVLKHDDGDTALMTYFNRVGGGYDNQIGEHIETKIDEAIEEANKELKMFHIGEFDSYSYEKADHFIPQAYGGFDIDMSMYGDLINDDDFVKEVKDVLYDFDMYPDWFDSDMVREDGITIDLQYEPSPYGEESVIEKIESFASELEQIESRFDVDEFKEKLHDHMIEKGYVSSEWKHFGDKVDINNLEFEHFGKSVPRMLPRGMREQYGRDKSIYISEGYEVYDYKDPNTIGYDKVVGKFYDKYERDKHPLVLLSVFLSPLLENGVGVYLEEGKIFFVYGPSYNEDKTRYQFIKELKLVKSIDKHFNFFGQEIAKFWEKYVRPYIDNERETGEYNIDPNIKLPIFPLKGRKESEDQGVLPLSEKNFSGFFWKNYLKS